MLRNFRQYSLENFLIESLHIFSSKWWLESNHLINDAPKTPDITFDIIGLIFPNLRRGIVRRRRPAYYLRSQRRVGFNHAGDVVDGKKAYGCSNWRNGCRFVVWKTIAKKDITPEIVDQLLTKQVTDQIEGFTSKAGKPFAAKLKVIGGEVKFGFAS